MHVKLRVRKRKEIQFWSEFIWKVSKKVFFFFFLSFLHQDLKMSEEHERRDREMDEKRER